MTSSPVLAERRREDVDDALRRRGAALPMSTRYSLTLEPRCRTSSTRPMMGEPNGMKSLSFWRCMTRRVRSKKASAARVGVQDAPRPPRW